MIVHEFLYQILIFGLFMIDNWRRVASSVTPASTRSSGIFLLCSDPL